MSAPVDFSEGDAWELLHPRSAPPSSLKRDLESGFVEQGRLDPFQVKQGAPSHRLAQVSALILRSLPIDSDRVDP